MKRLPEDGGVDVKRWGLRLRLHPRTTAARRVCCSRRNSTKRANGRACRVDRQGPHRRPALRVRRHRRQCRIVFVLRRVMRGRRCPHPGDRAGERKSPPVALQHRGEWRLADPGAALCAWRTRRHCRTRGRMQTVGAGSGAERRDAHRCVEDQRWRRRGSHPAAVLQGRAGQSVAAIHVSSRTAAKPGAPICSPNCGRAITKRSGPPSRMSCWS